MKKSIVIRGRRLSCTQQVVDSIRHWFNGEIIYSCWKGDNISDLQGVTKFVLNPDPGPGPTQNVYRQLVSGYDGLRVADGEIVLLIRSDITMEQDPFVFFDEQSFSKSTDSFRIFEKKITVGNIMTINPSQNIESLHEQPFRVGDWFHIGMRQDLIKLFGVKDMIPFDPPNSRHIGFEQNCMSAAVKKFYKPDLDLRALELYLPFSWDIILNNFRIINNYSTAHSFCLRPDLKLQPDNHPSYLMQKDYERKYRETFSV